jgi:hypothetical protein
LIDPHVSANGKNQSSNGTGKFEVGLVGTTVKTDEGLLEKITGIGRRTVILQHPAQHLRATFPIEFFQETGIVITQGNDVAEVRVV